MICCVAFNENTNHFNTTLLVPCLANLELSKWWIHDKICIVHCSLYRKKIMSQSNGLATEVPWCSLKERIARTQINRIASGWTFDIYIVVYCDCSLLVRVRVECVQKYEFRSVWGRKFCSMRNFAEIIFAWTLNMLSHYCSVHALIFQKNFEWNATISE